MTGAVLHAGDGGELAPEIVWAALDCPSYTPPLWGNAQPSLLASLHAELLAPVPAGEPLAVVGWSLGGEGRKHRSATAILARRRPRCSRAPRRCGSVCVAEFTSGSLCTCLRP